MKILLSNWKTTSAGLTTILGAVIHLVFAVKAGKADENTWTTSALVIVAGIGLMAAGDSTTSVSKTEADTTFLKRPNGPSDPKP